MKYLAGFIGLMAAFTIVAFWTAGLGLTLKKTFGVAEANADREIFEQSQSYNEGMIRDLENLRQQYLTATTEQKAALKGMIMHRFSVFPKEKLPYELRTFYQSL